jgi:hypothetical protein
MITQVEDKEGKSEEPKGVNVGKNVERIGVNVGKNVERVEIRKESLRAIEPQPSNGF